MDWVSNMFYFAVYLYINIYIYVFYTERQKSCTTYSFDFFWIKIDDFKNQRSLVFMPVQKTIVSEKIKCVGNHAYIFGRKM